ncbi:MAG: hypothetical protein HETSPECPRED_001070 [Heterodermia speciosa]|uniref:RelA/SpoT domain-containing protein n=1 Tax=Heterodermia speciosa TaxID=116794 RepID=A0A8H3PE32_9LECA|nr:MAG: hypothetical protein HETSPECPRED_001070 [Heterodermia speciosa]
MAERPLSEETQTVLNHYNKPEVRKHYEALTLYGHTQLTAALAKLNEEKSPENDGLQARVSSRTKDFQSLCENVKLKAGERSFRKWSSIRDAYKDLAGVRLTLYIPGATSRKKAEELIKSVWPEARISRPYTKTKETEVDKSSNQGPDVGDRSQDHKLQGNESDEYNVTHAGYKAVHYDIKKDLKKECGYGYEAGDRFEIQVVCLLLHGWQEAQHDVQYKTIAYGVPSNAERRILDAINGISLSGDLLLEQFYQMFYSRVYQRFNEVDDLTRFLRDSDLSQHADLFPVQCQAHLMELLRKHDKNFPMAARECIKQLGAPDRTDLDITGKELIQEIWIGFLCLAQRLEASCSVDPDYDAYDDPCKQGRAIMTTLLLMQDLSEFAVKILLRNMGPMARESDVVNSLISISAKPWNMMYFHPGIEHQVNDPKLKAEILPAWTWFKSQGKNTSCFPGLVFRLVIREAVPAVTFHNASERVRQLHGEVAADII